MFLAWLKLLFQQVSLRGNKHKNEPPQWGERSWMACWTPLPCWVKNPWLRARNIVTPSTAWQKNCVWRYSHRPFPVPGWGRLVEFPTSALPLASSSSWVSWVGGCSKHIIAFGCEIPGDVHAVNPSRVQQQSLLFQSWLLLCHEVLSLTAVGLIFQSNKMLRAVTV